MNFTLKTLFLILCGVCLYLGGYDLCRIVTKGEVKRAHEKGYREGYEAGAQDGVSMFGHKFNEDGLLIDVKTNKPFKPKGWSYATLAPQEFPLDWMHIIHHSDLSPQLIPKDEE